ncbi:MAG: type I glyceraldehyde-3-phosphate dehydrogenase [Candidatus Pacebacteria bacterium RIFOXYB1_FULL_39_46]|nr:MAG: type I glyceraldehyde-3-phosphate dehydrogenase [Candidatus Pacebacteria bacterium RIFOXYA1_FULL_38_18]OGJ38546.1 MAG: type I glyceraldehyde-3-phosphate dehydrogenase [Candidatus Pacebacteria bacterium RIFOXYB1_FULL_39_46]OGJ40406.1 MAG: type I glyceraldehyde-3-phosphate dehydrogenase [Candidatus Pacebacteria bacterium RIFOXYC1_FULL_39_21]OGJ40525.1 MAG: type I glyceraldehyde-3-phosphate dehydrogenase [Candidatus Pacebacteria bacterium RIFOXYD1_FULL_39_27]
MKKNFGINGFGRIGRVALRVWWKNHRDTLELKAINTSGSMDLEGWAHLLKYDSNYGQFPGKIEVEVQQTKDQVTDENPVLGKLLIDGQAITITAQRDPAKIPWNKLEVATVIESTGAFRTAEKAQAHLTAGAKQVIISAPAKGDGVEMGVLGINQLDPNQNLHSNASCTTQCVATVAQVMVDHFGVEKATLTTIHAYTDDQNLHDNSHKDLRRARAAAMNIVPTSTGAAKATGQVIPELDGLFDGLSVRVPVATGSLSDMVFITKKDTTVEEVNRVFEEASQSDKWRGILAVTREPLVSSDIIGRSESSIVDLEMTQVIGGNLVKIISWYDNEWGYCNRLIEQVVKL